VARRLLASADASPAAAPDLAIWILLKLIAHHGGTVPGTVVGRPPRKGLPSFCSGRAGDRGSQKRSNSALLLDWLDAGVPSIQGFGSVIIWMVHTARHWAFQWLWKGAVLISSSRLKDKRNERSGNKL
jgi:hypothetical protein